MSSQVYYVIVIGAGQSGLAMGYYLSKYKINYIILDVTSEIGQSWKERYDSLKLFTPKNYNTLPGLDFTGDPNSYPTKNEVAEYLQSYAKKFDLNIQLNTRTEKLKYDGDYFIVQTNQGIVKAKQVVVATGPFQKPFIPKLEGELPQNVLQVHTSEYKNPSQIIGQKVLIVGAGNSGAQLAVELAKTHQVTISARSSISFRPYNILGKSLFWWIDKLGLLNASKDSFFGKKFKNMGDPVIGLELKKMLEAKIVKLKPSTVRFNEEKIVFSDKTEKSFDSIIWATGFTSDYNWIDIPDFLDDKGTPKQNRGITSIEGLYFLGLPWMYSRNSGLMGGVGRDASFLANVIKDFKPKD